MEILLLRSEGDTLIKVTISVHAGEAAVMAGGGGGGYYGFVCYLMFFVLGSLTE